ncbi:hypothetical protein ABZV80_30000 [Streptomyces sp. NPDC005132]|uniref:hypothetical protein n=1 Tax=Streptomyces sp. NPDC005132 TaxID=3154294 RepID=UPI0033A47E04
MFAVTRKVQRGLVAVPRRTLEDRAAAGGDGLVWEDVDGISQREFWPQAPGMLRVAAMRRQP